MHLNSMGEVFRMDAPDEQGRKTWVLNDQAQEIAAQRAQAEHSKRACVVPARQIGMQRHWMDVALFGPAREEVA